MADWGRWVALWVIWTCVASSDRPVPLLLELCGLESSGAVTCGTPGNRSGLLEMDWADQAATVHASETCTQCGSVTARRLAAGCCVAVGASVRVRPLVLRVTAPTHATPQTKRAMCPTERVQTSVRVRLYGKLASGRSSEEVAVRVQRPRDWQRPNVWEHLTQLHSSPKQWTGSGAPVELPFIRCDPEGVDPLFPQANSIELASATVVLTVGPGCQLDNVAGAAVDQVDLPVVWERDGQWSIAPWEAGEALATHRRALPACLFASADATRSVSLLSSPEDRSRGLAFPAHHSQDEQGRPSAAVRLVSPTTVVASRSASATGLVASRLGGIVSIDQEGIYGVPRSLLGSGQDSMNWATNWAQVQAQEQATGHAGAVMTPTDKHPLVLHFPVINQGWLAAPSTKLSLIVAARKPLEWPTSSAQPFSPWILSRHRQRLQATDPRVSVGGGILHAPGWDSQGTWFQDANRALSAANSACPLWDAFGEFVHAVPIDSAWDPTHVPRSVRDVAEQFEFWRMDRFEWNMTRVQAGLLPATQPGTLMSDSVGPMETVVIDVSLERSELPKLWGLAGWGGREAAWAHVGDQAPWGVCFALVPDHDQATKTSAWGRVLGAVAVPHHRLHTAWVASTPKVPVPPNWLPLILGIFGSLLTSLLGYLVVRRAHFCLEARRLAKERREAVLRLREREAREQELRRRTKWRADPSLIPPECLPAKPTTEMLEAEAEQIRQGDKSLMKPFRLGKEVQRTGLIFNNENQLIGSLDPLGVVRDMKGQRLGILYDPMKDADIKAFSNELIARRMLG
jgi:hypothetical protein